MLLRNLANLTTLLRVILVFFIIAFLNQANAAWQIAGLILLVFTLLLDGLDGFIARKLNSSNNIGSIIDTLGDRITENVLLIFLAYKGLIPFFIPVVFVSRSFIADFIRNLAFHKGIGTFAINKSKLGFYIVASKSSRTIYLVLKYLVFLLGAFILVFPERDTGRLLLSTLSYAAILITALNILRFLGLLHDAKGLLKDVFSRG
ncbi:MAG: CDP-alcohol phosphatidyltransferase family protein [Candidatus Omnitrophica bacterium]|nr:CDP-alcohol phosphatidyltransferase family protein [Candidatus Omnitrophota bacterium]